MKKYFRPINSPELAEFYEFASIEYYISAEIKTGELHRVVTFLYNATTNVGEQLQNEKCKRIREKLLYMCEELLRITDVFSEQLNQHLKESPFLLTGKCPPITTCAELKSYMKSIAE